MRRHLSHRESRTPPSCNSSPETPPSGPTHSCPSHPCCFCWCCCCSCSCLTQRDRDRAVCGRSRTASNVSPPGSLQRLSVVEVSSWSHSFGRLLENTAGQSVFMEFLCSEHSQENMLFWLACQELKDQTRQAAVTETAKQIYLDYISILSPNEVSIDAAVRETINRKMAAPTAAIFDEAQVQIYALMHRDSAPCTHTPEDFNVPQSQLEGATEYGLLCSLGPAMPFNGLLGGTIVFPASFIQLVSPQRQTVACAICEKYVCI
ncbi:hypothetical protein SKAU_G00331050 [Synaphobranchus kaupii]|uniref:RGS domain-containing protein n=1 Tax=Synaphobranchus kaupii TaxID=118154 RepID=A0A9Q1IIJ1_SYNKA|nr:hypothetical protein SKAU_G00331050 [Synaphobranchus kaupii]